jgi:hypothetical protein
MDDEGLIDIPWQNETVEPETPSLFRSPQVSATAHPQPLPSDPNYMMEHAGALTVYEPPPPPRTAVEAARRQHVASRECMNISRRMTRQQQRDEMLRVRGSPPPSRGTAMTSFSVSDSRLMTPSISQRISEKSEELRAERTATQFMVERVVVERLKAYGDINPVKPPSRCIHRLMDDVIPSKDHASVVRAIATPAPSSSKPPVVAPFESLQPTNNTWGYGAAGAYDGIFSRECVLQIQRIFNPYTVTRGRAQVPPPVRITPIGGGTSKRSNTLPRLTVSRNVNRALYHR